MNDFNGFEIPKSNYSKLPHAFIGELHRINSLAELKVILYVLRHTWGYGDANKKITNDEFCNGRKSKNGVRLDKGCGLSPKSIRSGVQSAMEHGYIIVEVDGSDPARQKHYYSLVMIDDSGGEKVTPENDSGGEKVTPGGGESNHRTEKETLERKITTTTGRSRLEQNQQPASEPTLDPDYATVVKAYEQNIGMLTPMLSEVLHDMVTEYPVDWIVEAVEIACTANVRKLNYVKAVCENWSRDGRGPKDGVAEPGKKQVVDVPEGF